MRIIDAAIPGVKIIEPDVFGDYRGYFMETWSEPKYAALNFVPCQDNESFTAKKGTLRGLHFQMDPMSQAKIVRVISGAVMDVAVDLRPGSPTYKQWVAVELSADNKRELFIPRGFGHVFVTLEENCEVNYKVDNVYSKENERSIRYDDPQIGLVWPEGMVPVLSEKDKNAPLLRDCDCDFTI